MIGKRLKELRMIKGKTQKQMGEFLGVSESQYQQYEYNIRTPELKRIIIIADFFDISIDYLLNRTEKPNINK